MSKIEWTDETWNPVVGCSKISEGCRNCYALRMANRLANNQTLSPADRKKYQECIVGRGNSNVANPETAPRKCLPARAGAEWSGKCSVFWHRMREPQTWRKPRMVFVCSMGDLFHEDVEEENIDAIMAVMAGTPRHTYQILTKRADRMETYFSDPDRLEKIYVQWCAVNESPEEAEAWPLPNVWLGVTAENQAAAEKRIPHLLCTPAAVRFVSVEPMLGAVDFNRVKFPHGGYENVLRCDVSERAMVAGIDKLNGVDWVIAGGESGPGARPMHPDWARSLRDQCAAANVPFFFKQWGEWQNGLFYGPCKKVKKITESVVMTDGHAYTAEEVSKGLSAILPEHRGGTGGWRHDLEPTWMARVGKKAAGRILDGVTHDEFPKQEEPNENQ